MNKSIEILFSAASTGAGIKLLPLLSQHVQPSWLALVISAFSGAALFVFLRFFYSLPMLFPQLRRYLDSKFGIEGYWFEQVDNAPAHPYSFAWIRYKPSKGKFSYKGRNFRRDLSIHARWQSSAIVTDEDNDRIQFLFEADVVKGPETLTGYGMMEFAHHVGNVFTAGSGSFVDTGADLKRRTFTAERVTGQFVKSVIGTTKIRSDEDIKQVVTALLTERGLRTLPSNEEATLTRE